MDNRKKKRAVIFDCDGVMFDSRRANIHYYNHILGHFGLPSMKDEEVEFVHMHTADESIRYIFRGTSLLEDARRFTKQVDYIPFLDDMVMEPGLKALLRELKPLFGLAVATNRSTTIGKVMEHHGLAPFFDIVVSSLDVENPKPHPESLLKIADFFGIESSDAFYVGDSPVDHQAARASGVIFISFKNRAIDADYHADSMKDVGSILDKYSAPKGSLRKEDNP